MQDASKLNEDRMDKLDPLLQTELGKILRARRHSMYIKLFLFLAVAVIYATVLIYPSVLINGFGSNDGDGENLIPIVHIDGLIAAGKPASFAKLQDSLTSAFEYEADGVILAINSPGGAPAQSIMIHDEILRLKAKHNKKVVVVAADTLASGAYLIAMSADEIYANQASIVGSIGVIMQGVGVVDLAAKLGVERRTYTAGESKSRFDPMSPVTDADREKANSMLTEVHSQFKDIVKKGRGERLDYSNEALFSGDFWTGREALDSGMIDGLAGINEVVIDVFKAEGTYEKKSQLGLSEILGMFKDMLGLSVLTESHLKPGIWLLPAGLY